MKKLFLILFLVPFFASAQQQVINVGTGPNDHTGDPLRNAFIKTNANFTELYGQAIISATAGGTNTYTASPTPSISSYIHGQKFLVTFTNANTGTSTLNISSLGAKTLKKFSSGSLANLVSGDIPAGSQFIVSYDGTNSVMQIVIPGGSGTDTNAIHQGSNTATADFDFDDNVPGSHTFTIGGTNPVSYFGALTIDSGTGNNSFMVSNGGFISIASFDNTSKGGEIDVDPSNGIFFRDSRTVKTGAQYGGDYSSAYTTRSLVDKGYVTGAKTFTGKQTFFTPTTGTASVTFPHGSTPSSPVDGDFWSTTAGFFGRVNGSTVGPFSTGGGGSGWALTGSTNLTGATDINGTSSNTIQFKFPSLGTTVTDGAGLWLKNATTASAGSQQISPSIVYEGNGWHTGSAGSQSVKVKNYFLPIQQSTAVASGLFNTDIKIGSASPYSLFSTNVSTGKTIVSGDIGYDQPPMFEFVRHFSGAEIGRGSIGYLGSTEMNISVNMDYTSGSHKYYDSLKSAMWYFQSNVSNSFGMQWTKAGHTNDDTMWTTYGKKIFEVEVIPNTTGGEAVQYGSLLHTQQIDLIDDNYGMAPNALIKLSGQKLSITGADQLVSPRSQIGTRAISASQVLTLQYASHETLVEIANEDNNSNSSHLEWLKNKAGSYNLSAGTKIGWNNYNTLAEYGARSSGTLVVGSFTGVEHYWNTTNAAGSQADRMILDQEGNLSVTGTITSTGGNIIVQTAQAGGRNLTSADNGTIITTSNSSPITITVVSGLPIGFHCTVIQGQSGTGTVVVSAGGGVTSYGTGTTVNQGDAVEITHFGTSGENYKFRLN